ncbi:uncharacterized protein [Panulirus ornatus]
MAEDIIMTGNPVKPETTPVSNVTSTLLVTPVLDHSIEERKSGVQLPEDQDEKFKESVVEDQSKHTGNHKVDDQNEKSRNADTSTKELWDIIFQLPKHSDNLKNPDVVEVLDLMKQAVDVKVNRNMLVTCKTEFAAQQLGNELMSLDVDGESLRLGSIYKSKENVKSLTLYAGGLPEHACEEDVRSAFCKAERVQIFEENENERYCLVSFVDVDDAQEAFWSRCKCICGKDVRVELVSNAYERIMQRPLWHCVPDAPTSNVKEGFGSFLSETHEMVSDKILTSTEDVQTTGCISEEDIDNIQSYLWSQPHKLELWHIPLRCPKKGLSLLNPELMKLLNKASLITYQGNFTVSNRSEFEADKLRDELMHAIVNGERLDVYLRYKTKTKPRKDKRLALFVGGLPSSTTKNEVMETFCKAVRVEKHVSSGKAKTDCNIYCFVYFKTSGDIQEALDKKPWYINGIEAVVNIPGQGPKKQRERDKTLGGTPETLSANKTGRGSLNESTKRKWESQASLNEEVPQVYRVTEQLSNKKTKLTYNDDRPLILRWNLLVILSKTNASFSLRDPEVVKLLESLKKTADEININRYITVCCKSETAASTLKDEVKNFQVDGEPVSISEVNRAVQATKKDLHPIYVGNMSSNVDKKKLEALFPTAEKINRRSSGGPYNTKRFYFVYFKTAEEAQMALDGQPYYLDGEMLIVNDPKLRSKSASEAVKDQVNKDLFKGERIHSELLKTSDNIVNASETHIEQMSLSDESPQEHLDPLTNDRLHKDEMPSENDMSLMSPEEILSRVQSETTSHEVYLCLPKSKKSLKNPDIMKLMKILDKATDVKIHREFHVVCPTEDAAEKLKIELENTILHEENIRVVTKYKAYREPVHDPKWNALYVGGLLEGTTKEDVMKVFPSAERVERKTCCGKIKSIRNVFCYIYFHKEADVKEALQHNPWNIRGKEVWVDEAIPDIPKRPQLRRKRFRQQQCSAQFPKYNHYQYGSDSYEYNYKNNQQYHYRDDFTYPQRNYCDKLKPTFGNKNPLSRYEKFAAYNW